MPMLSFIASPLSTKQLIETFKPFLEISVDDDPGFLLRFADTRVLPALDSILCKENIGSWRQGIAHWWLPDREGNLTSLPEHASNNKIVAPLKNSLNLSQTLFNQLIDAGESDAILDAIFDQNSDLLKDMTPSVAYALVQRLKTEINGFNITNFPDTVMFCTTALATSEHFYAQQEFNKLLTSGAWVSGKLGEAFFNIDDASWAEIEMMHPLKSKQEFSSKVI
jgi:hypothetical protein